MFHYPKVFEKNFEISLDWKSILFILISWRIGLFFVQLLVFSAWKLTTPPSHLLFYIWQLWDGYWHTQIAQHGYYLEGLTLRFPLYPLLIKFFAPIVGNNFLLSGILISFVSLYFALLFLYKLVVFETKNQTLATLSVILLLIFPTSFFLIAVYSESLFLLLTILSFYFFQKDKILPAGLLGGLAVLTRPQGIILFPAFILGQIIQKKTWSKVNLFLLAIPLSLIPWCLFLYLRFGNPFVFLNDLSKWGEGPWQRTRELTFPLTVLFSYLREIPTVFRQLLTGQFYNLTTLINIKEFSDFLFFILFLVLGIRVAMKMKSVYSFYLFASLLLMLSVGTLKGAPRFVLVLFPAFIILAQIYQNKWFFLSSIFISTLLLVTFLLLFSLGFWVA